MPAPTGVCKHSHGVTSRSPKNVASLVKIIMVKTVDKMLNHAVVLKLGIVSMTLHRMEVILSPFLDLA